MQRRKGFAEGLEVGHFGSTKEYIVGTKTNSLQVLANAKLHAGTMGDRVLHLVSGFIN